MINKGMLKAIELEWRSGVLLNPFKIIDEAVSAKKPKTKKIPQTALPICNQVAKLFLDCTDYLVDCLEDDVKAAEEQFLAAMLLYLYTTAPVDEHKFCMVCVLIDAGERHKSDLAQTDLDRLFKRLRDENDEHPAWVLYRRYQKSYMRKAALQSIRKRFSPLIGISSGEDNMFAEISKRDLFEFAAAVIHDCDVFPLEPGAIYGMTNEIVFATVALAYMMIEIDADNQNRNKLFEILAQPKEYAAKITAVLKAATPDDLPGLEGIINYWYKHCEKAAAAGNIDSILVNGAMEFFSEFK